LLKKGINNKIDDKINEILDLFSKCGYCLSDIQISDFLKNNITLEHNLIKNYKFADSIDFCNYKLKPLRDGCMSKTELKRIEKLIKKKNLYPNFEYFDIYNNNLSVIYYTSFEVFELLTSHWNEAE
jgi:hypothetical protein